MGKITRFSVFGAVVLLSVSQVFAGFSTIHDATSGDEISLWQILDVVASGTSWNSTAYLNAGAGGLRVDDDLDQVWEGGDIDISMTTLYWGGSANPSDSLGQSLVYDDTAPLGTGFDAGLTGFGDSTTLSGVGTPVIWGDDTGGKRPTAWSLESLNAPTAFDDGRDGLDRMVTFDVTGLDISAWDPTANGGLGGYVTIVTDAPEKSWIIAFDPGVDGDYQDMVVYMQGAVPIPAPGAIMLGSLGIAAVGWLRNRRNL